jgi:nucleotide-binding universal stress UspA family protein
LVDQNQGAQSIFLDYLNSNIKRSVSVEANMYNRILVAVDGSDTSNLALGEAIRLAEEQGAALRLVHVVDETPIYLTADAMYALADFQTAIREAGKKVLTASAATARQGGVEAETKFIVLDGLTKRICDAINDEAKAWPADLIVIGTHGRRGFNHLLLGSVAESVIRLADKPILVIRGKR